MHFQEIQLSDKNYDYLVNLLQSKKAFIVQKIEQAPNLSEEEHRLKMEKIQVQNVINDLKRPIQNHEHKGMMERLQQQQFEPAW